MMFRCQHCDYESYFAEEFVYYRNQILCFDCAVDLFTDWKSKNREVE